MSGAASITQQSFKKKKFMKQHHNEQIQKVLNPIDLAGGHQKTKSTAITNQMGVRPSNNAGIAPNQGMGRRSNSVSGLLN